LEGSRSGKRLNFLVAIMVITLDDNTEQLVISLVIIVLFLLLLGRSARSARSAPGLALGGRVDRSEATLSRGRLFLVPLSQGIETVLDATLVARCLLHSY
jgi:hypothetical protein